MGIVLVTLSLVMISALPMSGAAAIPNGQKWALLVGISDYGDLCGYGDLNWCHKDAADMYNVLVSHGWMPSHIRVLVNSSATEANILAGIQWLTASSAGGMAFFYFSGHGSFSTTKLEVKIGGEQRWQQAECICPYDCNTWTYEHMIFDYTLAAHFSDCKAKQTIMMFDSCYAGGFVEECGITSRLLMCACATNEMSWEGGNRGSNLQIQNGVYTYIVIKALAGAGDYNGNGVVSLDEAAQYAIIHTRDLTQSVHSVTYDGISGETYL